MFGYAGRPSGALCILALSFRDTSYIWRSRPGGHPRLKRFRQERRGWPGHRRFEETPFFGAATACHDELVAAGIFAPTPAEVSVSEAVSGNPRCLPCSASSLPRSCSCRSRSRQVRRQKASARAADQRQRSSQDECVLVVAANVSKYYSDKGEEDEIVAFNGGLHNVARGHSHGSNRSRRHAQCRLRICSRQMTRSEGRSRRGRKRHARGDSGPLIELAEKGWIFGVAQLLPLSNKLACWKRRHEQATSRRLNPTDQETAVSPRPVGIGLASRPSVQHALRVERRGPTLDQPPKPAKFPFRTLKLRRNFFRPRPAPRGRRARRRHRAQYRRA